MNAHPELPCCGRFEINIVQLLDAVLDTGVTLHPSHKWLFVNWGSFVWVSSE